MNVRSGCRAGAVVVALGCLAGSAFSVHASPLLAQAQPPKPEMMENCPGLVAGREPRVTPASLRLAALAADQVRLTYVGHSTFVLESARLVRIATDFNDYVRPPFLPDVVTMNRAHSTHYTDRPDPGIKHVLRGWEDGASPARHDITVQDVRIRNVPTNIRNYGGGTERHGNSIFVFEVGNMCIAHLGHLHHTLTQAQLNEIGRIDIAMVPVDGTYTLDLEGMMEVVQGLKAQIVVPMHYFSSYTLDRFLERMKAMEWDIERLDIPSAVLSKATMPPKPKVLVMPGR